MKFLVSVLVATAVLLSGCASIIHGTGQDVGFSSSPTNALVTINGVELGRTPLTTELKRKNNHMVKLELDGYMPYETTFTRKVSGWVWGNIVFGGLIGLAVDGISGGIYKLTPEQLHAQMLNDGAAHIYEDDAIYVAVVLTPSSSWQKIGELQRAD